MNLTPKQLEIVKFVVKYRDENGLAPTLEEIAQDLGVSKITVYEHVAQLERKGAITKQKYQSRSIQVGRDLLNELQSRAARDDKRRQEAASQERPYELPLLGTIAAGAPIEAIVDQRTYDFGELVPTDRASYVLRVRGSSMIDDGIHDGDFVLVEHRSWASNGETVVAIIDDNEATLKKFFKEGAKIRLQPANESLSATYPEKCEVRGVVVGLVRKY